MCLSRLGFSRSGNPDGDYINIIQENTQAIVDLKQRKLLKELEFSADEILEIIDLH